MTLRFTGNWMKTIRVMKKMATVDFKSLHREIGEYVLNDTRDRFITGRGPDGVRWPKSRRVKQGGGQTLVKTRKLEGSLTYKARVNRVDVGTNDKRAAIHQFGGKIRARSGGRLKFKVGKQWVQVKSVTIPARPYIGLNKRNRKDIGLIVTRRIGDVARD